MRFVSTGNLRLIRDVAHHRSVSKAARLNDVSQSAASQAIAELERELEVILFDRGKPSTRNHTGRQDSISNIARMCCGATMNCGRRWIF